MRPATAESFFGTLLSLFFPLLLTRPFFLFNFRCITLEGLSMVSQLFRFALLGLGLVL